MSDSYVYIIQRTDYNHPDDDQGDFTLVSAYGSLQSANAAAKAHWDAEKTEDCPDGDVDAVNEWMKDDGCYAGCAVVETSKRHRFIVTVSKVELKDGQVAAANDHASKETLNKKGAAKKRKAKNTEDDEDEEDDGGEATEEEKTAGKSENSAAKKQKNESRELEIVDGSPDCLKGLQFVISGTLEGFTRDEAKALVVNRGGKTLNSISKNVDYVILGVNPGPKKKKQIDDLGLETLELEDFNNLIKELSGQ